MEEYFTYDPDDGFETFSTKEEAIVRVNEIIEKYKSYAEENGCYDEDILSVCWGKVKQRLVCDIKMEDV